MGTMCAAGCNMGGTSSSETIVPQTRNSVMQEDKGENEEPSTPCPDDNCDRGRMPFAKPNFRFKVPHGKHGGKDREKFRRPHKKPAPTPEPENPETPTEPAEGGNN